MGVLEIRDFSFPIDDFTLTHVQAVLENALPEFPFLDLSLFFTESDRVEFRLTDVSDYSIFVKEQPALCEDCLTDIVRELMLTGGIAIVGPRQGVGAAHATEDSQRTHAEGGAI